MLDRTVDRARGRWHGILTSMGIDKRFLVNRHGPCPACGGKDRYRFDDKQGAGSFYCSQCGAGNGLDLLMKLKGWDFKQAASEVDKIVGSVKLSQTKPAANEYRNREAMNSLWLGSRPVTLSDPVGIYLNRRTGITEFPKCLRFCEKAKYSVEGEAPRYFPALIAMMTDSTGKPCTIHRTFLSEDGTKAQVDAPRKLMPGYASKGGAIRLSEVSGEFLGIAEGVETALSSKSLHGVPCWAAISEGLLRQWMPPAGVSKVMVFGDNDPNYVGQSAAYDLAKRLTREGLLVHVKIPVTHKDWNDVAQEAMR